MSLPDLGPLLIRTQWSPANNEQDHQAIKCITCGGRISRETWAAISTFNIVGEMEAAMRTLVHLALLALLAGCTTQAESTAQAEREVDQMIKVYGPACERLGYKGNSDLGGIAF